MSNNNPSAVLDVTTESRDVQSLLRDKDNSSLRTQSLNNSHLEQSSSIDSFSTINDIENMSELNMIENADLSVKVDNPQKHLDALETYITFRVTTHAARIEFQDNEYVVRRRYNDFLWLKQRLMENHPFCITPPLPAKHSLIGQLDRYSKDFIIVRMKALNVFINRITQHPILSCNDNFRIFLTAQQDFNTLKRSKQSKASAERTNVQLMTHSVLKNKDLEFDRHKSYLTVLNDKLSKIDKISGRINKERSELIGELNQFHPVFVNWSEKEPLLQEVLVNIGKAVERNSAAQSALIVQTHSSPIRDFLSYIEVVQDVLRRRDSFQYQYESSNEELNRKHQEKDKLQQQQNVPTSTNWMQSSNEDKLEKLGTCIPQLVKKVELHQDNLECANESLRSDFERWQMEKQACLKKLLLDFVNRQINYYQASTNAWEHVTAQLASENGSKRA